MRITILISTSNTKAICFWGANSNNRLVWESYSPLIPPKIKRAAAKYTHYTVVQYTHEQHSYNFQR